MKQTEKFSEVIIDTKNQRKLVQQMPVIRVSSNDSTMNHLKRVFSLIQEQNKQSPDKLEYSKVDVSEYIRILDNKNFENSQNQINKTKQIQVQLQKQLSEYNNLKDVNDKLFYTPIAQKSPKKKQVLFQRLSSYGYGPGSQIEEFFDTSMARAESPIRDQRKQQIHKSVTSLKKRVIFSQQSSPKNRDSQSFLQSDKSFYSRRKSILLNSKYSDNSLIKQIFKDNFLSEEDDCSQRVRCINDKYKLNYDKDSFIRFYKFKQSLQSQNILFNQLQQQQKLKQGRQNLHEAQNNQDFFVNVSNFTSSQQIRYISIGCSFTFINHVGYLIGGKSTSVNKKGFVEVRYIEQQLKFQEAIDDYIDDRFMSNDIYNRYGHRVHAFQEKLVILSGESGKMQGNRRKVYGDMIFFWPETLRKLQIHFERPLIKMRAQSSCLLGKYLYCHGGYNEEGNIASDIIQIDLSQSIYKSFEWQQIECSPPKDMGNPFRAYSEMCPIFYASKLDAYKDDIEQFTLHSLASDIDWKYATGYIQREGFYVFGGLNEISQPTNDLFVLTIDDEANHHWVVPKTVGKTPPARYMHSFTHYAKSNVLVLFGGRNDGQKSQNVLNDMHVLNLDSLIWNEVTYCNQRLSPRFNFVSQLIGSKLIILGGLNQDYKITHDYEIVEIDQEVNFKSHANKYLLKKMVAFFKANFLTTPVQEKKEDKTTTPNKEEKKSIIKKSIKAESSFHRTQKQVGLQYLKISPSHNESRKLTQSFISKTSKASEYSQRKIDFQKFVNRSAYQNGELLSTKSVIPSNQNSQSSISQRRVTRIYTNNNHQLYINRNLGDNC